MTNAVAERPATIEMEIAAYEELKEQLETTCLDKWVVIHGGKVEGTYDEFNQAAADAVKRFGRGPYLIRQVGQKPTVLPASVVYSSVRHGH